ncbi:hypothetical protein H9P43_010000 [Blastocladiella emersonii ATCC 22665]|nr:hypothetical protein H9P43_010000 [Blastocladiella emersonii ATCC 22665]
MAGLAHHDEDRHDANYLDKRKLGRPFITTPQLAAIMFANIITGQFTGWNVGLLFGFSNMVVASVIGVVLFICVGFSVCEMCAALPFASGPAAFAQVAMNSGAGAVTGALYALTYTLMGAFIMLNVTSMLTIALPFGESVPAPVYWIVIAAFVLALHSRPPLAVKVVTGLAMYCLVIVIAYLVLALFGRYDGAMQATSATGAAATSLSVADRFSFNDVSFSGVILAFPFAICSFVGFEVFPVVSEETKTIHRSAPRAMVSTLVVTMVAAFTMILTAPPTPATLGTQPPNAAPTFAQSGHPLFDHALDILCSRLPTAAAAEMCFPDLSDPRGAFLHQRTPTMRLVVGFTLFPPFLLTLLAGTFTTARHVYTLARAGVLPTQLAITTRRGAPLLATTVTSMAGMVVVGLVKALPSRDISQLGANRGATADDKSPDAHAGSAAGSMGPIYCPDNDVTTALLLWVVCTWVCCVSYIFELISFLVIRRRLQTLPRPFVSPVGVPGAVLALAIVLGPGMIAPVLIEPVFIVILLGTLFVLAAIASAYWLLVARARMADSPEKLFIRYQLQQLYGRPRAGPITSTSVVPPLPTAPLLPGARASATSTERPSSVTGLASTVYGGTSTTGFRAASAPLVRRPSATLPSPTRRTAPPSPPQAAWWNPLQWLPGRTSADESGAAGRPGAISPPRPGWYRGRRGRTADGRPFSTRGILSEDDEFADESAAPPEAEPAAAVTQLASDEMLKSASSMDSLVESVSGGERWREE